MSDIVEALRLPHASEIEHRAADEITRLRATNTALREALEGLPDWLESKRYALGAVDGYDYYSGQEYGLRVAQIEAERRITALNKATGP